MKRLMWGPKPIWLAGPLALLAACMVHAGSPPKADAILGDAKAQAAPDGRAIFAIFGASWCGWCKRLDQYMNSSTNKPIIDKYFVTAHFTVQEHEEKRTLNTPGGDALFAQLGGAGGLPFFALLDSQGAQIVNSNRPSDRGGRGTNIGFPDKAEEIDWFMTMLHKAAPRMTSDEATTLKQALQPKK